MNKLKDALNVSNVQSIVNVLNDKPLFGVIAAVAAGAVGVSFYAMVHDVLKHGKNVEFRYGNFSLRTY